MRFVTSRGEEERGGEGEKEGRECRNAGFAAANDQGRTLCLGVHLLLISTSSTLLSPPSEIHHLLYIGLHQAWIAHQIGPDLLQACLSQLPTGLDRCSVARFRPCRGCPILNSTFLVAPKVETRRASDNKSTIHPGPKWEFLIPHSIAFT